MYDPGQLPDPSGRDLFRLIANFFLFICRESLWFIFLTLLVDFKDPIQNRDRVSALWAELKLMSTLLFFFIC